MKTKQLTVSWELSENNIIDVHYKYCSEQGDYLQPPSESIEIDKMVLNGDDVTDVLYNYEEEIIDAIINDGEYNIDSPINI